MTDAKDLNSRSRFSKSSNSLRRSSQDRQHLDVIGSQSPAPGKDRSGRRLQFFALPEGPRHQCGAAGEQAGRRSGAPARRCGNQAG